MALLDRLLLLPSVRWYIRSRAAKVLAEVGQRLKIHVRPFQQIGRQVLIDRLIFDDKVQQAAQAVSRKCRSSVRCERPSLRPTPDQAARIVLLKSTR